MNTNQHVSLTGTTPHGWRKVAGGYVAHTTTMFTHHECPTCGMQRFTYVTRDGIETIDFQNADGSKP